MNQSKTLLIAPGAGNPESPLYDEVYGLLGALAREEGYSDVDVSIRWPGQASFPVSRNLTVDGAASVLGRKFENLDQAGIAYDILARSFGCCVALAAVEQFQPQRLESIILWGAAPHWKVWQLFVENLANETQTARQKGVCIDHQLYPSSIPIEALLKRCRYPVRFAFGEKDRYTSNGFASYLEHDVCSENPRISFAPPVPGAPHEITQGSSPETREAYRAALFRK